MTTDPLVIPMDIEVLAVNNAVLARDQFRWWQYNYLALTHYKSPEPMALDRSVGGQQAGMYLSWTLPDALRHSGTDVDGTYPLVPNRWLVVRLSGTQPRVPTAWVLESDCPFTSAVTTSTSSATSMYLVDHDLVATWLASSDPVRSATTLSGAAGALDVAALGVSFPADDWTERFATPQFLTAVAPGNPLFATFMAHNNGVFSFQDPLDGIDGDSLSYLVAGWYSDAAVDPLASATDAASFAALLAANEWQADDSVPPTTRCVCHGLALDIAWDRTGSAPTPDPLTAIEESGALNVGVGNTTIDAFTALIESQLDNPAEVDLLKAFQYDLMPVLSALGGPALLSDAVHDASFGGSDGGVRWSIVADSADTEVGPSDRAWLLALNTAQHALEEALSTLTSQQFEVFSLWLKNGYLSDSANVFPVPPDGVDDLATFQAQLAAALDPTGSGSVMSALIASFAAIVAMLPEVPQPDWSQTSDPQAALRAGIDAFAAAHGIGAGLTLKAEPANRSWMANNPVLVLSGLQPPTPAVPTSSLSVRGSHELITALAVDEASIEASTAAAIVEPLGGLVQIPVATAALLAEFVLLDPGSATALGSTTGVAPAAIAAVQSSHTPDAFTGVLPALGLAPWTQAWTPMFIEWTGTYVHLPVTDTFTFDGNDYALTATASGVSTQERVVGGISLLSPHPSVVFASRLQAFVEQFGGDDELSTLESWIAATYQWQFTAQELTGFHQLLALRDGRAFRLPGAADLVQGAPLGAMLGFPDPSTPTPLSVPRSQQGSIDTAPLFPNGGALPFHGSRQGAFYFTDILLYDRFGRTLNVIESGEASGLFDYRTFPVKIDAALTPDQTLVPEVQSVLQFPPRLLQAARLDIDLLDAVDDALVYGQDAEVQPISGWVIPNHLDASLLVFSPTGSALGEFRLYAQANGSMAGSWSAPPHTTMSLADVQAAAPHVHDLVTAPGLATEAGFAAFLDVIDQTLWTTDPLGDRTDANLTVLVGRPLALVRMKLSLTTEAEVYADTGWAATFDAPANDAKGVDFAVRLGNRSTREDGVIGYLAGAEPTTFNATAAPASGQTFVEVVGPVGDTDAPNYLSVSLGSQGATVVTALVDPRAAMHAYTGILPVTSRTLPQDVVETALAQMEISFALGPLLTTLAPSPDAGGDLARAATAYATSITYPTPAEQNGTWSWWELGDVSTWTGRGLVAPGNTATAPLVTTTLREGYLAFRTDLEQPPSRPQAPAPPQPSEEPS